MNLYIDFYKLVKIVIKIDKKVLDSKRLKD